MLQSLRKSLAEASDVRDAHADRARRLSVDRRTALERVEQAMGRVGFVEKSEALLREELGGARREAALAERRLDESVAQNSVRFFQDGTLCFAFGTAGLSAVLRYWDNCTVARRMSRFCFQEAVGETTGLFLKGTVACDVTFASSSKHLLSASSGETAIQNAAIFLRYFRPPCFFVGGLTGGRMRVTLCFPSR